MAAKMASVLAVVTTGWEEAIAVGTVAGAVLTGGMATATAVMAKRTRQEASATLELARLGQLAYRPVLSVETSESSRSSSGYNRKVTVWNVGSGPALGCLYAAQEDGQWCMTPLMHVAAGTSRPIPATSRGLAPEMAWWTPIGWAPEKGAMPEVAFCRDVFNHRYRFLIDHGGHVLAPEIKPPEDCQGTAGGDWWTDVALWGNT